MKDDLRQMYGTIRTENERQRMKSISRAFSFTPFSQKQRMIMTWWCNGSPARNSDGIIADGAIRSGKTVSMSLSYGLWAMTRFNLQNFLICGKTIGSLRRNVVNIWKSMMKAQGFRIKDARSDNIITVSNGDRTNFFYLFGGKDEQSQDLVQGITAAGALFDEVALMPESFVNQATSRCSVTGSKYWFNCNPSGPRHWFKTNWIDSKEKLGLNYIHFVLDDNTSLSEEIKNRYRRAYSGMFFKRYILGQWSIAEGLIYDMFNEQEHTYGDGALLPRIGRRYIAADYGTVNPMVFLNIWDTDKAIYIRKEYYYDSKKDRRQKTDKEYGDDITEFIGPDMPVSVIIDPSAASFKVELYNRGFRVRDADNDVLDGIRMVASLFNMKKLFIHKSCVNTISELYSYAWDEKAQKHGEEKPLKQSDHACDALRYYVKTMVTRWRYAG